MSEENIIVAGIVIAPRINPDHWINRPEYAWFKSGYQYAAQSSDSIPTLAEISDIGGLYRVVADILRENDIIENDDGRLSVLSSNTTPPALNPRRQRDEARACLYLNDSPYPYASIYRFGDGFECVVGCATYMPGAITQHASVDDAVRFVDALIGATP